MTFEFKCYPRKIDDKCVWFSESLKCKGAAGQGNTWKESVMELEKNEKAWMEMYKEDVGKILYDAYHFEEQEIVEFITDEIIQEAIDLGLSDSQCAFCGYVSRGRKK